MTLKNINFRRKRRKLIQRVQGVHNNNNEKLIKVKIFLSSDKKTVIASTKSGLKGRLTGAAKRKAEYIVNNGIDNFFGNSYGIIKIKESDIVYA
jgi:hypothetical protein